MKSSQSKTTQSTSSTASDVNNPAIRSRDQQHDFSQGSNIEDASSNAALRGRNEFTNLQEQGQHNAQAAESFSSYEGAGNNQQQGDYSSYQGQDSSNFRRRNNQQAQSSQPQLAGASDIMAQTGINTLVDAWTSLMLGQVQIATQAAIRLAQCCFSPSLISGISEVQRRYAEDSLSSATSAASKLAQFTPRALNQNKNQFQNQDLQQNQHYAAQGNQPRQQQYS